MEKSERASGDLIMMQKKILVIEDEQDIADLICLNLNDDGAQTTHAADGIRGLTLALQQTWDLIVLDLTLPRCDGMDICQQVRECNPHTPIIMVSARSSEMQRVQGLNAGADDYLSKPFSISELLARIHALFRRMDRLQETRVQEPEVISFNNITLNPATHGVNIQGKAVALTAKEFELLLFFARAPGRVFKRTDLLKNIWGYGHEGYLHTVNSHINRLRAKIEPDPANPQYIETVWGVGYKLKIPSHDQVPV